MNPMKISRLTRSSYALGLLAAVAGLLSLICAPTALAQNSAQQAALARLARSQSHANGGSDTSVEAEGATLDRPGGLCFDAAGDLFIADTQDNIVREVNLKGVISTVAGTGDQGFGGDGGAATSALLDSPTGVAVDSNGNLYIADTHNHRIREVIEGTITTVAGTGVAGFSGDGGAAQSAMLNLPTAVAVDSKGNVYIADTNNHRIRELTGTTIATVAGDGEQFYSGDGGLATAAGLNSPNGVAVDAAFNIYIGDTHNQRVRKVTFATGIITTLAGTGLKGFTADGPAGFAALALPRGVAVDASGKVYVADSDNDRIRTISGGAVNTVAGNGTEGFSGDAGTATNASLDTPQAVAVAGTSISFADTGNNRVRTISNGTLDTIAGIPQLHTESLVIGGALSSVYGTGSLTATFSNSGLTGTGQVSFYDGEGPSPSLAGTATLSSNIATLNTSLLSAGTHYIVASYAGDAKNAAINSGVYVYVVTPAQLTAVAQAANLLYGQPIPKLAGTLSGVLAQDAGKVTADFSTTATMTSAPGTYLIAVQLAGSAAGNYTVALGTGSGSLAIAKAPTTTKLTASAAMPISGNSVTLTATVTSTTSGTPGGTVSFYNGGVLLDSAPIALSGGTASLGLNTLPVGTQSITAVYSGDTDFIASSSSPLNESVLSPDFTISATPAVQTILPLQSVKFSVALAPTNPTFLYPANLSVSGLPAGVTATFSPSTIAVGAGASTSVLTIAASGQAQLHKGIGPYSKLASYPVLALLLLPLFFGRRGRKTAARLSRSGRMLIALLALAAAGAITGCGGGGFFNHATKTYTVTITAVSGPNTHTSDVTLTVQ